MGIQKIRTINTASSIENSIEREHKSSANEKTSILKGFENSE